MVTGRVVEVISKLINSGWQHRVNSVTNTVYCVDTCYLDLTVIDICSIKSRGVNGRQQAERFLSAHVTSNSGHVEIKTLKGLERWVSTQYGNAERL